MWRNSPVQHLNYLFNIVGSYGPPVTTESRGRFESGFGYFEVFKKNWAPMPLAIVWAKPRRGQNPEWPPAAILDLLKFAILRRFYSNNTIEVSFLTNSEVRNPFQGLFFSNFGHFHPEIQDGRYFTSDNMLKSAVPANKRNIGNFWSEKVCQMNSKTWTEVSSDILSKFWRFFR